MQIGFLLLKTVNIKNEMPRDRIELSTPGFSDQCSTTELPRHYLYIISNLFYAGNKIFPRVFFPPSAALFFIAPPPAKDIYFMYGFTGFSPRTR